MDHLQSVESTNEVNPLPAELIAVPPPVVPAASKRPRIRKKRRTNVNPLPIVDPSRCYITTLPFELIAEVLIYTGSPKDVLAVARCCKYFCNTLLGSNSTFIWEKTRKICLPSPLPDPPSLFTESSYAAFVFDGGICEQCKKPTSAMYSSFALRLRLCKQPGCKSTFKDTKTTPIPIVGFDAAVPHRTLLQWVPITESASCLRPIAPRATWPLSDGFVRTVDWLREQQEYETASASRETLDAYLATRASAIIHIPLWMSFCATLHVWKMGREKAFKETKAVNEAFAKTLAIAEGWELVDLLNSSQTYLQLHHTRTNNLEKVQRLDYDLRVSKIEAELIQVQEARKRSLHDADSREARAGVAQHYERLRSVKNGQPLPTLASFRKLPIMGVLQVTSPGRVGKELKKSPLVQATLNKQLEAWREAARTTLSVQLGCPGWKTGRNNKLNPVTRLTARFQCSDCRQVANAYRVDECLDFAGVCAHECRPQKGVKKEWNASQFVKDEKAFASMTKVLNLLNINAEDPTSLAAVKNVGARIACLSCPSAMIMTPLSVIGHSHRHDEMEISILTQAEADSILRSPLDVGLAFRLTGSEPGLKAKQMLWRYGCRHCTQVRKIGESSTEPEKPKKLRMYHGLISHLKEKHGISGIRDEDFFYDEGAATQEESVNAKTATE